MTELELQARVADYLRLQYRDVIFHSDFGSGVKLTPGQAVKQKRLNGGRRAWPDMIIAKKATATVKGKRGGLKQMFYGALFLEFKRDGVQLKKKNGEWAGQHIAEQAEMLEKLRQRGYAAEFAVGWDEAKQLIDDYLGEKGAGMG